jgi:hypothetical protein
MRPLFVLLGAFWLAAAADSQNIEERVESSTDPQDLQALWDDFRQHPLDLTQATVPEIALLPFFDKASAKEIVGFREEWRGFFNLDDVIALPNLTEAQRDVLRALTVVRLRQRRQSVVSLYSRAQNGEEGGIKPEAWSSRVRAVFRNSDTRAFLYGVRNPDEPEFFGEASGGIEMLYRPATARLMLGDYQYEFGTGLIFAAPFGAGDWLNANDALDPSAARGLDLRPSSNRRLTYRGAAATIERGIIDISILTSWSRRDAALSDSGALRITEGETSSSAELAEARNQQLEERLHGAGLRANFGFAELGIAGYSTHFDIPLAASESETQPQLCGRHLNAGSAHLTAHWHGMNAVTEVAATDPGGTAYQAALSFRSQNAGFSLYHVRADEDFFSLHSTQWNGFGTAAGNEEATGARIHALLPRHKFTIDINVDRTPFRTATSPLRKNGSSMAARWQCAVSEEFETVVRLSRRWNEDGSESEPWESVVTDAGRMEWTWSNARDAVQLRFELRSAKREMSGDRKLGSLLFLQGKHRLPGFADISGRLTFFNLESDDVAMQIYEMPLRGEYPLAALSGSGRRLSVTAARDWPYFRPAIKITQTRRTVDSGEQDDWTLGMELTYRR